MLHPHDQVRIGDKRQIFQRFVQVARTYLAGSPRPMDRSGETHVGLLVHGRLASFPVSILAAGDPQATRPIYQIAAAIASAKPRRIKSRQGRLDDGTQTNLRPLPIV